MPSPYRAIFAAPGTKGFSAAGFFGRMPLSMMGIGVVTMISQLTGRYGLAGALSATLACRPRSLGPQVSRLVDRHGQRRVLRPVTLVALAAVAGLLLCAQQRLPDWTLFVFAAGAGCVPSVGAMIRARWAAIYRGSPPQLHTAYSLESIVDEVCFIFGPIVSIGLSTAWFPEAGPLLAAGFLLVGVFWLTAQRATEPVPHPREQHSSGSALRSRRSPGPGGHLRGDRRDLRGGRRGDGGLRRGAGPQGRGEPRAGRVRAGLLPGRSRLRAAAPQGSAGHAGGCWACARWP